MNWENQTIITNSADETFDVAFDLAENLPELAAQTCFVILLEGDLGAGKTCFVKGLCAGIGIPEDEVNSPTFTLVNEYQGGAVMFRHLDLYRLPASREAAASLGLDDWLDEPGVVAIEWSERLLGFSWEHLARISIKVLDEDRREITIQD
ncbi:MAG: tRNA (adenosine(37)-N6)-threonylcarbamoyltransferase complex ATPase subunit type 1 TsaE [Blastocatellia bacterium]|nr:tRNA (adenosine(37)-N6)-threonylcarbamoyltransferase complex ATPase subunit type 1 TsaE [Blastocatellia bacterium]